MSASVYSDAQWDWLFQRYREGHSAQELADFAHVSISTFYIHMRMKSIRKELSPLSEDDFRNIGFK